MIDVFSVRAQMKAQRQALSPQFQAEAAVQFCQKLTLSKQLDAAQHIAVYLAHRGELDLSPTINALWQQGKILYLPCLNQDHLVFKQYAPDSKLIANRFGILEITEGETIAAEDLDAVLVPLVAFDRAGHRIGMGKGYYDRSFAFRRCGNTTQPLLIGCAYAFQKIPLFQAQVHDVAMDMIETI